MIRSIALGLGLLCAAASFAQMLPVPAVAPGAYGRIEVGTVMPPPVIYAQPVQVLPAPVAMVQRPAYLYVPPEHARDWRRWCGHYHACGQPVYFVQERWVRTHYEEERRRAWEHDHGRHAPVPVDDHGRHAPVPVDDHGR